MGSRKAISKIEPILALYPMMMDMAPSNAMMPDDGTSRLAKGTPCDAAYAIVCAEKCFAGAIRKISENKARPMS